METVSSASTEAPRFTGDYSGEDYREWCREFGPQAQLNSNTTQSSSAE